MGATGATYTFETYTPILPKCSIITEYIIHETTSPATGKLTYPSNECSHDLCTVIDIDVSEVTNIFFYIEIVTTRSAGTT